MAASPAAASPSPLEQRAWALEGWTLSSLDPTRFSITATFSGGRVTGRSAVNTYGGACTVTSTTPSSGTLAVGALMSTRMAGPPDAMRAESAFHALLTGCTAWSVDGAALTLRDGGGFEVLVFREDAKSET